MNHRTAGLRVELEADDIRITTLMSGVAASNFIRNFDSVVRGIGALAGMDLEVAPGERLPEEVSAKAQMAMDNVVARPEYIADAVAYVVGLLLRLNIPELVVRPAQTATFFS